MPFPLDMKYVRNAEAQLGRKLPGSYVGLLCRSNGGTVSSDTDSWKLFPIFDDSDRKRLARTCNDIVRETKSARERPGFPQDALAIGSNGGGDLLIFVAETVERYGDSVYWWGHETDELTKVADDFLELDVS